MSDKLAIEQDSNGDSVLWSITDLGIRAVESGLPLSEFEAQYAKGADTIRALSGKEITTIKARIKADFGDEISDSLARAIGSFVLEVEELLKEAQAYTDDRL